MIWLAVLYIAVALTLIVWAERRDNVRVTTFMMVIGASMLIQFAYVELGWL